MKKILTAIVLFVFVALPMSVMAMTSISDNDLSTVTGQAGVSISMDVQAQLAIGKVAWGDSSGIDGNPFEAGALAAYNSMGFVGLDSLNMTVHVSGRTDGPYSITNALGDNNGWLASLPLTIDVGTSSTGVSLVAIGLPTAHIVLDALTTNIFVSGGTLAGGPSGTIQQLGQIYLSNVDVKMGQATGNTAMPNDAGYVTIGAADATGGTNAGVHIGLNVKIGSIYIGTMSYGNTNIIPGGLLNPVYTSGGYIGMKNFTIGNVTINGGVSIGLHTTDLMSAIYALPYGSSAADLRTCVNIVFDNGTYINIPGAIYGTVLLAQDKNLSATPTGHNELGNFFIGGVTLTLVQPSLTGDPGVVSTIYSNHSNVQISAH